MRKNVNTVTIAGRLYQHDLKVSTVKNQSSPNFGKAFIAGTIYIATDDDNVNVVSVHYTYVAQDKKNSTFDVLNKIINTPNCSVTEGAGDAAFWLKADTSIGLNEYYLKDQTTGAISDELKSNPICEGGFLRLFATKPREDAYSNTFIVDMLMTGVKTIDINPEKGIEKPYLEVSGAVFNFRNEILPMTFVIRNDEGVQYFSSLGINTSNPCYMGFSGIIYNSTIKTSTVKQGVFGAPVVTKSTKSVREWLIESGLDVYQFGAEGILTMDEVSAASQARQVKLAEIKKRAEDYAASKKAAQPTGFGALTGAAVPAAPSVAGLNINPADFKF